MGADFLGPLRVIQGPPWWSTGEESACQRGGRGSIPGPRTKVPHAMGQLRPTRDDD